MDMRFPLRRTGSVEMRLVNRTGGWPVSFFPGITCSERSGF
jgi:hypothetical protein